MKRRRKAHQGKVYGGWFADEDGFAKTGLYGHPSRKIRKTFFRVLKENCQDYMLIREWREWNFFLFRPRLRRGK